MKCPSCGKIIEDGSEFCYWCGESFEETAPQGTPAEKQKAENRTAAPSGNNREAVNVVRQDKNRTALPPEESNESKTSVSGILIEVFSLLLMFGGMIGGIVILTREMTAIGLGLLAGSLVCGLFGFGFGRIICLLTSINAKMK